MRPTAWRCGCRPWCRALLAPNPGPFTFKGTGVYIVGAGDEVAVIDPGPAMPDAYRGPEARAGGAPVSHILITHTHRDHSPAAAPLKAWSGAKTYALARCRAGRRRRRRGGRSA